MNDEETGRTSIHPKELGSAKWTITSCRVRLEIHPQAFRKTGGRGGDPCCPGLPAQISACRITAPGS